jgi:hypothetical protein
MWGDFKSMAVVVILVVIILVIVGQQTGFANTRFSNLNLQQQMDECRLAAQSDPARTKHDYCMKGGEIINNEQPLHCSICIGASVTEFASKDNDLMPDVCEQEDYRDSSKVKCVYRYGEKKWQCCTSASPCDNTAELGITCTET